MKVKLLFLFICLSSFSISFSEGLYSWGDNAYLQLGIGEGFQVGSDNDGLIISCGDTHTIGIKSVGSLWFWGVHQGCKLNYGSDT
jgi:alpha-tubulin suppressor-like RCC1 family protein